MRKEYETPKLEIVEIETEDIISTSGNSWNSSGEDGKPESGLPDIFSLR